MSVHELPSPPPDVVSSLAFSSDSNILVVSSWSDSHGILVYTRSSTSSPPFELSQTIATSAPVLDLCFGADNNTIYYVGLDSSIHLHNLTNNATEAIAHSSHCTSKVAYSRDHDLVLALSWNGTLFAINASSNPPQKAIIQLAAKPFALSLTADKAVVTMAERKVHVYALGELKAQIPTADATNGAAVQVQVKPWQERESSLKFMTRASATMPDGTGFATSSIEGRVGVEWFSEEANTKMYAFKCHRDRSTTTLDEESGQQVAVDIVYPVNAIAFHPVHGTFATGGGDGVVALWDAKTKRRIRQYPKLAASVASLAFSPDGKELVIGISPGFEDGHEQDVADPELVKVFVRELAEGEAKGKPAKEK